MKHRTMLLFLMKMGMFASFCDATVGPVEIKGSTIFVEGEKFFVKGICYSPVPIGDSPTNSPPYGDYFTSDYRAIWERDFPMLTDMGANTIRIYGWNVTADHTEFLDTVQEAGLKVILAHYLGTESEHPITTVDQRSKLIDSFVDQVKRYKGHPAVLAWSFGNEINGPWNGFLQAFSDAYKCGWNGNAYPYDANGCVGFSLKDNNGNCAEAIKCVYSKLFGLVDHAAKLAHEAMVPYNHVVLSSFADVDLLTERISSFDSELSNIDVWGAQVYRGQSFNDGQSDFLLDFEAASSKPLVLTEFGVDAYNDPCGLNNDSPCYNTFHDQQGGHEDEATQALWNVGLAKELMTHDSSKDRGKVAGGCLMAWQDEMWKTGTAVKGCAGSKVRYGQDGFDPTLCDWKGHVDCPATDITVPNLCGYFLGSTFDHYVNEGWFGVMRAYPKLNKAGTGPGSNPYITSASAIPAASMNRQSFLGIPVTLSNAAATPHAFSKTPDNSKPTDKIHDHKSHSSKTSRSSSSSSSSSPLLSSSYVPGHIHGRPVDVLEPRELYRSLQAIWTPPLADTWVWLTGGVVSIALVFTVILAIMMISARHQRRRLINSHHRESYAPHHHHHRRRSSGSYGNSMRKSLSRNNIGDALHNRHDRNKTDTSQSQAHSAGYGSTDSKG